MRITAELSLYPLQADFVGPITDFIHELRREPGIEMVTNQLSTQLRGDFAAVTGALHRCMAGTMASGAPLVFVVKYINADLPIASAPSIDG